MNEWSNNRLTVVGPKEQVQRFLKSNWKRRLDVRHLDWMENFQARVVSLFETDEPPIDSLRALSRRFRDLALLLEYELERHPIKGLVVARSGRINHSQFEY